MDENKEHFNVAYNIDCMEYMKSLPDNAFDLAVVDPPYGDASVERERERDGRPYNRFGGWFDRYKETAPIPRRGQMEQIPRTGGVASIKTTNSEHTSTDEVEAKDMPQSTQKKVCRTGGTWAEKYGKKS